MKFSSIQAVIMDMDGVLWRGNEPLPGLHEIFEWLDQNHIPYALATNNSSKTQADYVAKLASMEVENVPEERIVTSATATAAYMHAHYPAGTQVYVLGMEGLRRTLEDAGFDTAEYEHYEPQVVVVGVDFALTYERLKQATLYVRAGADFIGTNPDKTFPSPEGLVPGAGSMIAALQAATDREAIIIGKPGLPMFETALKIVGAPAENTLMIGDRLNTDITGAQTANMRTALVFTGVSRPDELTSPDNQVWPDVAFEGLVELVKAWAGHEWFNERQKLKRGRMGQ